MPNFVKILRPQKTPIQHNYTRMLFKTFLEYVSLTLYKIKLLAQYFQGVLGSPKKRYHMRQHGLMCMQSELVFDYSSSFSVRQHLGNRRAAFWGYPQCTEDA